MDALRSVPSGKMKTLEAISADSKKRQTLLILGRSSSLLRSRKMDLWMVGWVVAWTVLECVVLAVRSDHRKE